LNNISKFAKLFSDNQLINMSISKIARQAKVKEIISSQDVSSQEELCEMLKRGGFTTTQATLSRDLHELGIVRIPADTGFRYVFHLDNNEQLLRRYIGMEIINIQYNESTVVLRTLPGRAAGVALFLDKLKNDHILGTVAGDDAIIIIPDAHRNIKKVVDVIKEVMIIDQP
jgi:transcriptional regulator of arginine metabolism